jgi:FdhE protein
MSATSVAGFQPLPEETVPVISPVPAAIFEKRAARLRFLATGHAIGEYLEAMACLTEAQIAALQVFPPRSEKHLEPAPSLNACYHNYGETWQKVMGIIISRMLLVPLPEESRAALSRLKAAALAALEFSAQMMVCGNHDSVDLAASPFIAAALQVYWTDLASRIQSDAMEQTLYACPVCGSAPVAGVILGDRKLRYLCCSLCATHWYVPRLTCTKCGSTEHLVYFAVEGDENKSKAEACNRCHAYLKLFYLEGNPEAEAFTDDLATLGLDLLITEKSYNRSGVNLFLLRK